MPFGRQDYNREAEVKCTLLTSGDGSSINVLTAFRRCPSRRRPSRSTRESTIDGKIHESRAGTLAEASM